MPHQLTLNVFGPALANAGGSHDRTDFLPLKHGLAIMALGAMVANPELRVQIVPVGVSPLLPFALPSLTG